MNNVPNVKVSIEANTLVYFCESCGVRVGDATGLTIHLMDSHKMTVTAAAKFRKQISVDAQQELLAMEEKRMQEQGIIIKWLK